MKRLLILSLLALFSFAIEGQQIKTTSSNLSYLGQKPPGMTPELFALEIAPFARQRQYYFLEPCFSTDGKTVYFLSTMPLSHRTKVFLLDALKISFWIYF